MPRHGLRIIAANDFAQTNLFTQSDWLLTVSAPGAGVAELVDAADSKFDFHVKSCSIMLGFSVLF